MSDILIYRTQAQRMKGDQLADIARVLGIEGKAIETEEALAVRAENSVLVYAQPGSRMAGVLFYTDQSKAMAEPVDKLLDSRKAKSWANEFLDRFNLFPPEPPSERIALRFDLSSYTTEAVTFDGEERRKSPVSVEIGSKITLNEIRVVGPRAKIRMIFKDRATPAFLHRGLWHEIDIYEERELVEERDAISRLTESLVERGKEEGRFRIADVKLAYFASEFRGGPDLLAPYYFVEVEHEDPMAREHGIEEGPKQVFPLPAYR